MDVNGLAMHDLYRVLKRQSDLFVKRYGMAMYLKEHNSKVSAYQLDDSGFSDLRFLQFLTNRYGVVKHFYSPSVETAVIEADINRLLKEDFNETIFEKLLNPPEEYFA